MVHHSEQLRTHAPTKNIHLTCAVMSMLSNIREVKDAINVEDLVDKTTGNQPQQADCVD